MPAGPDIWHIDELGLKYYFLEPWLEEERFIFWYVNDDEFDTLTYKSPSHFKILELH